MSEPVRIGSKLEKAEVRLGIAPLTDCAPIVVAYEKGFFAAQGVGVEIVREPSWSNIRDKVAYGLLDGAQMLGPMPIAGTLGIDGIARPMVVAAVLSMNGNAFTVSTALHERMLAADPEAMKSRPLAARALKKVIDEDAAAGRRKLNIGIVFAFSAHAYELRYWMAAAGIDPDEDVTIAAVPPPRMAEQMAEGRIDAYCVGEPWNQHAVAAGIGRVVVTSQDIWTGRVEKVFAVTQGWADKHPCTHLALVRGLIEAGRWLDQPENRIEAAHLLAKRAYIGLPAEIIARSLTGQYRVAPDAAPLGLTDFHVFSRYATNFPWVSQAEWFIAQMIRWGHIGRDVPVQAVARSVFRPDLFRRAAAAVDLPCPSIDSKIEGDHPGAWQLNEATRPIAMCADTVMDGRRFEPGHALAHVDSFGPHRLPPARAAGAGAAN